MVSRGRTFLCNLGKFHTTGKQWETGPSGVRKCTETKGCQWTSTLSRVDGQKCVIVDFGGKEEMEVERSGVEYKSLLVELIDVSSINPSNYLLLWIEIKADGGREGQGGEGGSFKLDVVRREACLSERHCKCDLSAFTLYFYVPRA